MIASKTLDDCKPLHLEVAARIAGHESTRTTQLYNRLREEISLDEIERIHI